MKKIAFLLFVSALISTTGCISAIKHGDIVSITERGFGVEVSAASSTTQTPTVRAGFFSTTVQIIPTSTNGISSPNFANTIAIGQTAVPFGLDVAESTASGNYQTGNAANKSNSISSQPIVPK